MCVLCLCRGPKSKKSSWLLCGATTNCLSYVRGVWFLFLLHFRTDLIGLRKNVTCPFANRPKLTKLKIMKSSTIASHKKMLAKMMKSFGRNYSAGKVFHVASTYHRSDQNSFCCLTIISSVISLWARAWAKILAQVCGQIGTYCFLVPFLNVLNLHICT